MDTVVKLNAPVFIVFNYIQIYYDYFIYLMIAYIQLIVSDIL